MRFSRPGSLPGRFRDHEERSRLPGIGPPDRDNTLVYIWDGIKRIVVRDSRIERIEANNAYRGGETFKLVQPLVVHGGLMPTDVVSVEAGPWDERGRRPFRYSGARLNKSIHMEQAIIEIGPHVVKFRGVDGFWVGVIETGQIPRDVRDEPALSGRAEECRPSASESSGSSWTSAGTPKPGKSSIDWFATSRRPT